MGAGVNENIAQQVAYSPPVANLEANVKAKAKRKVKRTVSKYQKKFGVELKKLKRKHPRTAVGSLMKKAHRLTKKALK
jgi:predicted metal-dependent hydrolase